MLLHDARIAAGNILALSEAAGVVKALQEGGIRVIVLKGAALSETVYAFDERPMADVDLLIPLAEHRLAHRLLRNLGVPKVANADRPVGGMFHNAGAYTAGYGISIDIHTHQAQQWRWPVDYGGVFDRAIPLTLHNTQTLRLCNEDALLYLAINQATDEYATDERVAEDVTRVINRLGINWEEFVNRAHAWRCTVPAWLTLEHARQRTGVDVPQGTLDALAPSSLRRRYLERMIDPAKVPPYRHDHHGRRTRQVLVSAALTDVWWRHALTATRFLLLRSTDWLLLRAQRHRA